jgi:hypothetical protein
MKSQLAENYLVDEYLWLSIYILISFFHDLI